MRDQDVPRRALAIHQVDETQIFRLEAHVKARAALPAGILEHVVRAAVAAVEGGALDVRDKVRHERRVIEPLPQHRPDAFHPRGAR